MLPSSPQTQGREEGGLLLQQSPPHRHVGGAMQCSVGSPVSTFLRPPLTPLTTVSLGILLSLQVKVSIEPPGSSPMDQANTLIKGQIVR